LTSDLPGRTSAFRIAEVRPQVNGIILKRMFKEGSDVKAGQQLYQIDPRSMKRRSKAQKPTCVRPNRSPTATGNWLMSRPCRQEYDTAVANRLHRKPRCKAPRSMCATPRFTRR
jgi:membrane fusion protein (multidrug efflux system)